MSEVKMKAHDTLFISSWSSDNIPPKGEFMVSEDQAKSLEAQGLASRVDAKSERAPANKAAPSPKNKSARKAKGK